MKFPKIIFAIAGVILIFHAGFAMIGAIIAMPLVVKAFSETEIPWMATYAPILTGVEIGVKLMFAGICFKSARENDGHALSGE